MRIQNNYWRSRYVCPTLDYVLFYLAYKSDISYRWGGIQIQTYTIFIILFNYNFEIYF